MTEGEGAPPPIDPSRRIPLRAASVIFCYLLYLWIGDDRAAGGVSTAAGLLLLSWTVIDQFTLRRRERTGLLQVGTALLGLGLLGLGVFLLVR